ncbi:YicC/YloC family endoribonuclease [Lacibacterium aquatile]|uniref:YicC/YloC family endoribonuclease n=1 Tax=Lacibacterium aquatile TaxID=1168082 RepID=A0ABW5DXR5_9PROT
MSDICIHSMTGFARQNGVEDVYSWQWELKSVNGKGLDIRIRLPSGADRLEIPARERIGKALKRGNISATLELRRVEVKSASLTINRAYIETLVALQQDLGLLVDQTPPRLTDLLSLRGVMEAPEPEAAQEDTSAQDKAILDGLDAALAALVDTRRSEGRRLSAVLAGHLDLVERLTLEARSAATLQTAAVAAKLKAQVTVLLEGASVPEDRMVAEIALLAAKADPTEEVDRLEAHVAAARELLVADGAVGRKLDFLAQEFNREANTLMSKAAEMAVTRLGLELKTVIDQFREQVQNVE